MKLKVKFLLHAMGEESIAVPVDEGTEQFKGILRFNKTSAYLWEKLEKEPTKEELEEALLERYDITKEQAADAVDKFVRKLEEAGLLELP